MIAEYKGTVPKKGDHVTVDQSAEVFEVADINSLMQTVNLHPTDGTVHLTRNVPWTSLKFVPKK
jgi:hypothetical protein